MWKWITALFKKPAVPVKQVPSIPTPQPAPTPVAPQEYLSLRAYRIARGEAGVAETDGDDDNPRIKEYDAATDLPKSMYGDDIAWCSAFHNWCFQKAGGNGTRDAMARSWLNWGQKITEPKEGDTVVFSSPTRGPDSGHVAFYVKPGAPGFIMVWGGNQGNKVCLASYPKALALGYRRSTDG